MSVIGSGAREVAVGVVEDDAEVACIDARAYMARTKKLGQSLAQSRDQVKALRASEQTLKEQVSALRVALKGFGMSMSDALGAVETSNAHEITKEIAKERVLEAVDAIGPELIEAPEA